MSTPAGVVAGLLGSAASEAAAFAAGLAIGPTLSPEIEFLKNEAWNAAQTRALEPGVAAEIAAEDVAKYGDMEQQAAYHGVAAQLFADLYGVSLTAPGTGELIAMLRRSDEVSIDFAHGLRKAKLEPQWDKALRNLADQRLAATDIAYMVVRGVLPDAGLLGLSLPTQPDRLKLPPQHSLDPITEAARTGWDANRLAMMVARSGLAMAPVMAAQANFRGILTDNDYLLTIARGDLFPAYAAPVLEVSRQIPTVGEAVQYQLRGFTDRAGRLALTQLHGMTDAHSDVLYNVAGRAPSDRQVYIGLARGAKYPATYADVPSPFREAIERSDIRPEFADIVYQNRYSLPSAFVVRSLLTDGAISQARGSTILQHEGWPADLADLVSTHYSGGAGTASDPHVTKAQNQLWTTTHRSYIAAEITDPTATAAIEMAGVAAASAPAVLSLWAHERALVRKQLSPAQIRKARNERVINPATGAPWTDAQAIAELEARGYDAADAQTLLEL